MDLNTRKAIFVGLLESLKEYMARIDTFHEDMRKHTEEFIWNLDAELLACTMDTASKIAEDNGDWVNWWVWESNFGAKENKAFRTTIAGKEEVDLSTPGKLFDFIQEGKEDE